MAKCDPDCTIIDFKPTMSIAELNSNSMYEFLGFLPTDAYRPDPR